MSRHDLVIKHARITGIAELCDIGIDGDTVVAIGHELVGRETLHAGGNLVTPGLVDTHLHLDKSRLTASSREFDGTLESAIAETAALKRTFTEEDVYERASQTLQQCVLHGTTLIRTHVEVDELVGLRAFNAIRALASDWASHVDIEICVFAQEGLTQSDATQRLIESALEDGAEVVGGAPYADVDPAGQLDMVFAWARRFGRPIDLHLDLVESPDGMLLEEVCRRTIREGMQGQVTVGHVTQLSFVEPARYRQLCALVKDADVAVTVLPATDLYLMGRRDTHAKSRGVADLREIMQLGGRCSVATNNVLNAFTPYGDGSLIRMANLYANITHVNGNDLEQTFDLVSAGAAQVIDRAARHELAVGARADLICLPVASKAEAVATVAAALWGVKNGRPTFVRSPARLHSRELPVTAENGVSEVVS